MLGKRVKMAEAGDAPIPRPNYRLQFHNGFGFRDAAALAPYLAWLGMVTARFPARCENERDWKRTEIAWLQAVGDRIYWLDFSIGRVVDRPGEVVDVGTVWGKTPVAISVPEAGHDLRFSLGTDRSSDPHSGAEQ